VKSIRELSTTALATALMALVVYGIVRWVPFGDYPGPEFFDLAAQTIPILLVALAVEAQARRFDVERMGKLVRVAAVVFLAAGETTAIAVSAGLYTPEQFTPASDVCIVVTAVGLLGGFLAVIAVALKTPVQHPRAPRIADSDGARTRHSLRHQSVRGSRAILVLALVAGLLAATGKSSRSHAS
jgi:hypothetical protein